LAGLQVPVNTDGISFIPAIRGKEEDQEEHPYLCWEFYE
jgi:hypothetical protein